ncbi:XTP/dITP diphosphohydrolase/ATP diphosphatase [Granulicella aggregans]|uniref:XTP/dITP diphosphohydrolase/ATP diphosphatase n=1 Tax=Granulicella aggregans TaxID=474949 RepID=A0A7W8E187_9BACT|nr:nucleoside triphosphate pyrophosphohydrolase [Granulicella aggregans]MBB5055548.1 XTP/dITP diphosphohydrolase/ATP diphosphatase [Granulicella aggregans]
MEKKEAAFAEAVAIMARLRGPDGCPWDREQTFDSIKRHTLEETYEVFDAIERRAWPDLKDELGDLLLQVLFYSQMAAEAGYFDIHDVAVNLNAKLIRRHPHIFGDATATDADAVLRNWEQIKLEEKQAAGVKAASLLDEVPRSMPPLLEAGKLGSKAAKVGFDWPNADGRAAELFQKLDEEIEELKAEVAISSREAAEDELGDVLFTAVNLARHLKIDPDAALRGANAKFRRRFAGMEAQAGDEGLRGKSAAELEEFWAKAKRQGASSIKNGSGEEDEIRSSDFVEG